MSNVKKNYIMHSHNKYAFRKCIFIELTTVNAQFNYRKLCIYCGAGLHTGLGDKCLISTFFLKTQELDPYGSNSCVLAPYAV